MAEIEKGLPNEPELKVEDINTNETVEIPNEPKEKDRYRGNRNTRWWR